MKTTLYSFFALFIGLCSADEISENAKDRITKMSEKLAAATNFTLKGKRVLSDDLAKATDDVADSSISISLARPNQVRIAIESEKKTLIGIFDGKKITMYLPLTKLYGVAPVPGTVDEMFASIREKLGIGGLPLPAVALMSANPAGTLMGEGVSGSIVGKEEVAGVECECVRLTGKDRITEIWIAADGLPRKYGVTLKDKHTFILDEIEWALDLQIDASQFNFQAPDDAATIQITR